MNTEPTTATTPADAATPVQAGVFPRLLSALTAPKQPEATPSQAGVFSLGTLGLRLLSGLGVFFYNFAPVGGFGVFLGARLRTWLAYALPLAVMVATDLILWSIKGDMYSPLNQSQAVVYFSFLGYVLLGRWLARWGLLGVGAAAILGSVQFFLLTNFHSWLLLEALYPRTLDGLIQCYVAGIPFYQQTFVSDLLFPFVFIAAQALWIKLAQPSVLPQEAQTS